MLKSRDAVPEFLHLYGNVAVCLYPFSPLRTSIFKQFKAILFLEPVSVYHILDDLKHVGSVL